MVTSLADPLDLEKHDADGWDVQLSLGSRWAEFVKNLDKIQSIRKVVRALDKLEDSGGAGKLAYEWATKLSLEDWVAIKKRIRELASAADLKTEASKPQVFSMGLPIPGIQLEVSAYWEMGRINVSAIQST